MNLILCATPRSGSTLLCALLRSSGVAGWPESWFRPQDMGEFAADWRIARADGSYVWSDYLTAARAAGSSANGVFAVRVMWDHLAPLARRLGVDGVTPALLERTFGPCRYVLLTRGDLVAQAVSRQKAEVSGMWHLGIEEALHPRRPVYDFAAISGYIAEAEADERAWDAWFARHDILPLRLRYEPLSAAPEETARRVLRHLDLPDDVPMSARNIRMADSVSANWAARYRAERG
ncbi:MAG: Stf0 family sulfotransferase [bacterium]